MIRLPLQRTLWQTLWVSLFRRGARPTAGSPTNRGTTTRSGMSAFDIAFEAARATGAVGVEVPRS